MAPNISNTETKMCTADFEEKSPITMKVMVDKNGTSDGSKTCSKTEGCLAFKTQLKWSNIVFLTLLHMGTLYFIFTFKPFKNLKTTAWIYIMGSIQAMGITAGAHRFWTHRCYKAKWPLRVILLVCYASAGQNNLYDWVRDHRVHHKYTDTDADPHNSNRGFFFSHIGWLMMKKHPEVIRKGRQIDMSDLCTEPVAAFGCRHFLILRFVFAFLLPVMIPVYVWNETWFRAFVSQVFLRYVFGLNCTWSVNSAAHIWGSKPYDTYINPTENKLVAFLAYGEGWHNYHHVFPWDYKAAELGNYKLNLTTMFIDFFAKIGWAYDLKQPSEEFVRSVVMRKRNRNHQQWNAVSCPDSKIE